MYSGWQIRFDLNKLPLTVVSLCGAHTHTHTHAHVPFNSSATRARTDSNCVAVMDTVHAVHAPPAAPENDVRQRN